MHQYRGVNSDRQKLLILLEEIYNKATSQNQFYSQLQERGIELYARNGVTTGIKTSRKFRFRSLGYTSEILQLLDKNISKNVRLEALKQIRDYQLERSKERERTKKRGY
jgi:TATA-binding protein-associated factor Taf7